MHIINTLRFKYYSTSDFISFTGFGMDQFRQGSPSHQLTTIPSTSAKINVNMSSTSAPPFIINNHNVNNIEQTITEGSPINRGITNSSHVIRYGSKPVTPITHASAVEGVLQTLSRNGMIVIRHESSKATLQQENQLLASIEAPEMIHLKPQQPIINSNNCDTEQQQMGLLRNSSSTVPQFRKIYPQSIRILPKQPHHNQQVYSSANHQHHSSPSMQYIPVTSTSQGQAVPVSTCASSTSTAPLLLIKGHVSNSQSYNINPPLASQSVQIISKGVCPNQRSLGVIHGNSQTLEHSQNILMNSPISLDNSQIQSANSRLNIINSQMNPVNSHLLYEKAQTHVINSPIKSYVNPQLSGVNASLVESNLPLISSSSILFRDSSVIVSAQAGGISSSAMLGKTCKPQHNSMSQNNTKPIFINALPVSSNTIAPSGNTMTSGRTSVLSCNTSLQQANNIVAPAYTPCSTGMYIDTTAGVPSKNMNLSLPIENSTAHSNQIHLGHSNICISKYTSDKQLISISSVNPSVLPSGIFPAAHTGTVMVDTSGRVLPAAGINRVMVDAASGRVLPSANSSTVMVDTSGRVLNAAGTSRVMVDTASGRVLPAANPSTMVDTSGRVLNAGNHSTMMDTSGRVLPAANTSTMMDSSSRVVPAINTNTVILDANSSRMLPISNTSELITSSYILPPTSSRSVIGSTTGDAEMHDVNATEVILDSRTGEIFSIPNAKDGIHTPLNRQLHVPSVTGQLPKINDQQFLGFTNTGQMVWIKRVHTTSNPTVTVLASPLTPATPTALASPVKLTTPATPATFVTLASTATPASPATLISPATETSVENNIFLENNVNPIIKTSAETLTSDPSTVPSVLPGSSRVSQPGIATYNSNSVTLPSYYQKMEDLNPTSSSICTLPTNTSTNSLFLANENEADCHENFSTESFIAAVDNSKCSEVTNLNNEVVSFNRKTENISGKLLSITSQQENLHLPASCDNDTNRDINNEEGFSNGIIRSCFKQNELQALVEETTIEPNFSINNTVVGLQEYAVHTSNKTAVSCQKLSKDNISFEKFSEIRETTIETNSPVEGIKPEFNSIDFGNKFTQDSKNKNEFVECETQPATDYSEISDDEVDDQDVEFNADSVQENVFLNASISDHRELNVLINPGSHDELGTVQPNVNCENIHSLNSEGITSFHSEDCNKASVSYEMKVSSSPQLITYADSDFATKSLAYLSDTDDDAVANNSKLVDAEEDLFEGFKSSDLEIINQNTNLQFNVYDNSNEQESTKYSPGDCSADNTYLRATTDCRIQNTEQTSNNEYSSEGQQEDSTTQSSMLTHGLEVAEHNSPVSGGNSLVFICNADTEVLNDTDAEILRDTEVLSDTEVLNNIYSVVSNDTEVTSDTDTEVLRDTDALSDSEVLYDTEVLNDSETLNDTEVLRDTEVLNDTEVLRGTEVLNDTEVVYDTDALNAGGFGTESIDARSAKTQAVPGSSSEETFDALIEEHYKEFQAETVNSKKPPKIFSVSVRACSPQNKKIIFKSNRNTLSKSSKPNKPVTASDVIGATSVTASSVNSTTSALDCYDFEESDVGSNCNAYDRFCHLNKGSNKVETHCSKVSGLVKYGPKSASKLKCVLSSMAGPKSSKVPIYREASLLTHSCSTKDIAVGMPRVCVPLLTAKSLAKTLLAEQMPSKPRHMRHILKHLKIKRAKTKMIKKYKKKSNALAIPPAVGVKCQTLQIKVMKYDERSIVGDGCSIPVICKTSQTNSCTQLMVQGVTSSCGIGSSNTETVNASNISHAEESYCISNSDTNNFADASINSSMDCNNIITDRISTLSESDTILERSLSTDFKAIADFKNTITDNDSTNADFSAITTCSSFSIKSISETMPISNYCNTIIGSISPFWTTANSSTVIPTISSSKGFNNFSSTSTYSTSLPCISSTSSSSSSMDSTSPSISFTTSPSSTIPSINCISTNISSGCASIRSMRRNPITQLRINSFIQGKDCST